MNTNDFWTCCFQCRTFSPVGCFSWIARRAGRTVCCALCVLIVCEGLRRHMTGVCAHVIEHSRRQDQSTRDSATFPLSRQLQTWSSESWRGILWLRVPPIWISLANGTRSHTCQPEDYEPGGVRQGWQHDAATRIERVFGMTCWCPVLPATNRLCNGHIVVPWQEHRCHVFRHVLYCSSTPSCSGFFSCAACVSFFLSRHVCAGVSAKSIHLTTTAPHDSVQVFWVGVGVGLRFRQPEFAERHGRGWRRTSCCGI